MSAPAAETAPESAPAPASSFKVAWFERAKPPEPPVEGYDKHLVPQAIDLDLAEFNDPEAVFDVGPEKEPATGQTPCFSPVIYLRGKRRNHRKVRRKVIREPRIEAMTGIVLDFDNTPEADFDRVVEGLVTRGLEFACHHSFNHATAEKPFAARVIIPLAEPVPVLNDEWAPTWERAVRDLGADVPGLDRKCSDAVHVFYLPRRPSADSPHKSAYVPGRQRYTIPGTVAVPAVVAAPVPAVVPAPASNITVAELRETLTRCPSKEAKRLGRGEAVSPPPGKRAPGDLPRKQAWHAATGALARVAPLGTPIEVLEEVCRPAWWKEQQESPEDHTDWETITKSLSYNVSITEPQKEAEQRAQEKFKATLAQRAANGDAPSAVGADGRREIDVGKEVEDVVVMANIGEALASDPLVFMHNGKMVSLCPERGGGLAIHEITTSTIGEVLNRSARLYTRGRDDVRLYQGGPTFDDAKKILESPTVRSKLRPLLRVSSEPILTPDNRLVRAGYVSEDLPIFVHIWDPKIRDLEVPEAPSKDDVVFAATDLRNLYADFSPRNEDERAVLMSTMVTLIGRTALPSGSRVPLHLITAKKPGSGKSLVTHMASLVAFGTMADPKQTGGSDEEARKTLLPLLLSGEPLLVFDNKDNSSTVGFSNLDSALTSAVYNDRVLGQSKTLRARVESTIVFNGNDLTLKADTWRRSIVATLTPPFDDPGARPEESYSNPEAAGAEPTFVYVSKHRGRFYRAVLTLLRARLVAQKEGRAASSGRMEMFQAWSDLIGGALMDAGLGNPVATREAAKALAGTNETAGLVVDFLARVTAHIEKKIAAKKPGYIEASDLTSNSIDTAELRKAFLEYVRASKWQDKVEDGKVSAQIVGRVLQSLERHSAGGRWLVQVLPIPARAPNRYRVEDVVSSAPKAAEAGKSK